MDKFLQVFVNGTIGAVEDLTTGVHTLRAIVLQNSLVLDFLLEERGGVCILVGQECCAWVLDNFNAVYTRMALV